MRKLALSLAAFCATATGFFIQGCNTEEACTIGSEGCDCTVGGACDPGLTCLSMICVNAGTSTTQGSGETTASSTTDPSTTDPSTTDPSTTDPSATDSNMTDSTGPKLDTVEDTDEMPCAETGCKKIDMLFAMDGSLSMIEEIQALYNGGAFLSIVQTLEDINCGGIDYRIGVTGDNDNGWITPNNWADPNPWFDSGTYTAAEISVHFQAAATKVANSGGASVGCEHVLSTAVNLLGNDNSGFIRDDALLVLVLMSDVDDYGAYDQANGNDCGFGCNVSGQPVQTIQDTLIALKGGDDTGVATVVIAGDPLVNGGVNICGQPQSCGAPVQAFHGTRLYEFAMLQSGMNGFAADICDGPSAVPDAVEAALTDNIDLACQEFEPVG